jgi:hypothetical protein
MSIFFKQGKDNFINKKANEEMIKRHVTDIEQDNAKNSVEKLYKVKKDVLETANKQAKLQKDFRVGKKTTMITSKNAHFLKGKRFANKIASDVSRPDQVNRNEKRIITDYSLDKNKVPIHKVIAFLNNHEYNKLTPKVQIKGLRQHDHFFRHHRNILDSIDRQEHLIATINIAKLDKIDEDDEI